MKIHKAGQTWSTLAGAVIAAGTSRDLLGSQAYARGGRLLLGIVVLLTVLLGLRGVYGAFRSLLAVLGMAG